MPKPCIEVPCEYLGRVRPGFLSDSMVEPTRLLLIDERGVIVHANQAWFDAIDRWNLNVVEYRLGSDYLAACRSGWNGRCPEMQIHGERVTALLRGVREQPEVIYRWVQEGDERWYCASTVPFDSSPGEGTLILHRDVTLAVRHEEQLSRKAFFDTLTGLPNFALFSDRLNHAITQSARSGNPLAIMFIDVDDFKLINDSYGHVAGNRVLREIAQRLSGCLREGDTVGRLGGDEFGVVLPGIGDQTAVEIVAEKMQESLSAPFLASGDRDLRVTASIGIALCPRDGNSVEILLQSADQQMYHTKRERLFRPPRVASSSHAARMS